MKLNVFFGNEKAGSLQKGYRHKYDKPILDALNSISPE